MYTLNNEAFSGRSALARRAQARPGWLPRLLAEALILGWAAVAGLFDGDYAARGKPRGQSQRRMTERLRLSMKKFASLLALILILGISSAQGGAEKTAADQATDQAVAEPAVAEPAAPGQVESDDGPPPFTLTTQDEDGPELVRLKAALRLLKHDQVTARALQTCGDTPGAGKALRESQARNGNTLRLLMGVIKKNGGVTPEIRAVMDAEVAEETSALLQEIDCQALTDQVTRSARDIHRADELGEDYKLVRARP